MLINHALAAIGDLSGALPRVSETEQASRALKRGGKLGNEALQSGSLLRSYWPAPPASQSKNIRAASPIPEATPTPKLEALKRDRFPPEGKGERVAKSLAALNQQRSIHLSPDEWRFFAEDVDILDI